MTRVVHLISSLSRGGRERQLATIAKHADENEILIICFNKSDHTYIEEYGIEKNVQFLRYRNSFFRLFEIARITKKLKPDIVWSWGGFEASFGILVSKFIGAKHINGSIRHGIVKFNGKHMWRMFLLKISRYRVANSFAGLKANGLKKGFVLYNGIAAKFFYENTNNMVSIRKSFQISPGRIIFISVANLVPIKDYITTLKALKRLTAVNNNFCYIIIGEGPERENIEKFIAINQLESHVKLLGRISRVQEMLSIADIFVHSSQGEGCSNAILEAMANGLPIVASNTGGTEELVDNSIGRLFKYKNIDELYEFLVELISERDMIRNMGKRAKQKARKNFSVEAMLVNFKKIIESVIH